MRVQINPTSVMMAYSIVITLLSISSDTNERWFDIEIGCDAFQTVQAVDIEAALCRMGVADSWTFDFNHNDFSIEFTRIGKEN
jgi:hypothetical protein